jgi:hypothetical protein
MVQRGLWKGGAADLCWGGGRRRGRRSGRSVTTSKRKELKYVISVTKTLNEWALLNFNLIKTKRRLLYLTFRHLASSL